MKIKSKILSFIGIILFLSISMPTFAVTVTYTYDNLNRVTRVDYSNGFIEEYTYDAAGNRLTLTASSYDVPSAPQGLSVSTNIKSLDIAWLPNSDTEGVTGYIIHYGMTPNEYDHHIDVSDVTSYKLNNLQEGTTYYVAVTAYNAEGTESEYSTSVAQTTLPAYDSDEDGMYDAWETGNGLDSTDATDAEADPDQDGLSNLQEYLNSTDINIADTDGDGFSDMVEISCGTNPLDQNKYPALVKGIMTDSLTGLPIAGATVIAWPVQITTTTNNEGYYDLSLATGQYLIVGRSQGYASASTADVSVVQDMDATVDLALTPATIFVPQDYSTIQDALYHATDGDIVFVSQGSYSEDIGIPAGVIIQGEGPGLTTITGSGTRHTIEAASNSRISGFSLTNGGSTNAVVHGNKITGFVLNDSVIDSQAYYASIYFEGCTVTLEGNLVKNSGGAGGIVCDHAGTFIYEDHSTVRFSDVSECNNGLRLQIGARTKVYGNWIHDNMQTGIWAKSSSTPDLHNNKIYNNAWFGIFAQSPATITDNVIFGNYPSGIVAATSSEISITGNTLYNHIYGGIWGQDNCNVIIKNNLIFGSDNSGIIFEEGGGQIINNTIAHILSFDNPASQNIETGSGIFCGSGVSATIQNNIIADSKKFGVYHRSGGTVNCSYNDLWMSGTVDCFNVVEGTGNLNVAPKFKNDFLFADITSAAGTKSTIVVIDTSFYEVGNYIEYDNDGIMREIIFVSEDEVLFAPSLSDTSEASKFIYYWGSKTDPTENYHLGDDSPCVDAGNPSDSYSNEPLPNGERINVGAYGNTAEAARIPLKGDVNGDGHINLADAILALKLGCGVNTGGENFTLSSDTNGDGKIGLEEAIYILQKVSGVRD